MTTVGSPGSITPLSDTVSSQTSRPPNPGSTGSPLTGSNARGAPSALRSLKTLPSIVAPGTASPKSAPPVLPFDVTLRSCWQDAGAVQTYWPCSSSSTVQSPGVTPGIV